MSNLVKHAKSEINILKNSTNDLLIEQFIPEILSLVKKFAKSGQSGGSYIYTANSITNCIDKLLKYETLSPITGEENEWYDVSKYSNKEETPMYQNNRLSSVFKSGINGLPYFLDAIIFRGSNGICYSGSAYDKHGNIIFSRQFIKLPFTPKTFYIDVIEKEVGNDNWENYILDHKQLNEVFEYYIK